MSYCIMMTIEKAFENFYVIGLFFNLISQLIFHQSLSLEIGDLTPPPPARCGRN